MGGEAPAAALARVARRVGRWPALLRDAGAAGLALGAVCVGDLLVLALPAQAALLLVLPAVALGGLLFGWGSAVLGLLVAALAISWVVPSPQEGLLGAAAWELTVLLAMAMALLCACLGARLWARQRERQAALLLDACANDALSRIAEAEARLVRAEADAAAARCGLDQAQQELQRASRAMARREAMRDGIEEALRREGGV